MVGTLLSIVMLVVLVAVVQRTTTRAHDPRLMRLMVAGYVVRLAVHAVSRDLSLFSHGGGGDYVFYEDRASEILKIWSFSGFEYITEDDLPAVGPTSLPPNLFALVAILNGGELSSAGCAAIIACLACLTCLNLYLLAQELGAESRRSFLLTAVLLFSPAYLLYTSDLYKDGIVLFFACGAVASAVRLARRFSVSSLAFGLACLWALWHVRFYLVFLSAAPLVVGLTGIRSRSTARPLFAVLLLAAAFVVVAGTTDVFDKVSESATTTFARGTEQHVRAANARGGSGVTFDDGGNPWGAMGPKLAYMVFSPFPWAGGSIGFQIGKLDTFMWYFIIWRAVKATRELWRRDRVALLMLLTFIAPITVAYATSFANVGLSLRQRMIVVMVTSVLAMQSWPRKGLATVKSGRVAAGSKRRGSFDGAPRPLLVGRTSAHAPPPHA